MSSYPLPAFLARADPQDLTGDEARSRLRRELMSPEYVERNVVARLWEWVQRRVNDLAEVTSALPLASWIAALVVGVLLLGALALLLGRTRGTGRTSTSEASAVLATHVSADELRTRALAASERGDHAAATADAYRALAVRQVERRRILDSPGATAHEVGDQLAEVFPDRADALRTAASLFDLALYSDRALGADDAALVLALDGELDRTRQAAGRVPWVP